VLRLLVTANVVPSSLILATLTMEAILSSETLVLTRAISEDSFLHTHSHENLKSYNPSIHPYVHTHIQSYVHRYTPADDIPKLTESSGRGQFLKFNSAGFFTITQFSHLHYLDPLRRPRDTPLSTKVGTKFRQQVAVSQSV
jgi:hypothetical protein